MARTTSGPASLPALKLAAVGGAVTLAGVPWAWAYSLSSRHGPAGYLAWAGPSLSPGRSGAAGPAPATAA